MRKLLVIALTFCFVSADEFFEPTTSLGGYGELHYDMEGNGGDGKLDFHRYIFYIKHQFSPEWSMMSEVEVEHNMVYSEGDGKLIELHQKQKSRSGSRSRSRSRSKSRSKHSNRSSKNSSSTYYSARSH